VSVPRKHRVVLVLRETEDWGKSVSHSIDVEMWDFSEQWDEVTAREQFERAKKALEEELLK